MLGRPPCESSEPWPWPAVPSPRVRSPLQLGRHRAKRSRLPRLPGGSVSTLMQPETLGQARDFHTRRNAYTAKGLCDLCAVAASYGHSHGFKQVDQPCRMCRPGVDRFPVEKSNGWRALSQGDLRGVSTIVLAHIAGPTPPGEADNTTDGAAGHLSGHGQHSGQDAA
jgi:hypothetical protein